MAAGSATPKEGKQSGKEALRDLSLNQRVTKAQRASEREIYRR
jgi:hypothetical protein